MKRKVLKKAKLLMARIPLKDISGTSMDANVLGDSGF